MKTLMENDIPDGYKFAAVDEDGIAYAFKTIPELNRNDACWYPTDEENSLLRVGEDFDATNWTTSLVEKKTLKKLTIDDIPEGYSWAAVDSDGDANAFRGMPRIKYNDFWGTGDPNDKKFIGKGYDRTSWQRSLVENQTLRKLTVDDIPNEYYYAAVDASGCACAFKSNPILRSDLGFWISNSDNDEDESSQFIGNKFDATNWETSLINKQVLKKLTVDDIPEGYDWATVDSNGFAYAHQTKPIITANGEWKSRFRIFISSGFDSSNWEHSLIMRKELEEYQEGFEEEKKDSMEPVFLENCTFNFTQEANCKADTDDDEELEIKYTSDLGLDRTESGFFVLKTEGWSISDERDIKRLLDRIKLLMNTNKNEIK